MFDIISSTECIQRNAKNEVECLVLPGFLERENNSEWGSPTFAQPKPKSN